MPDFLADVLSQPRNGGYALAVKTAMELHLPPTMMIYDARTTTEWRPEDKKLAMAYTLLEQERCTFCGLPTWVCRSNNNQLDFSIGTTVCYGEAELNSKANKRAAEKLTPGEHQYIIPRMLDGNPLPTRAAYMRQLAEEEE
jgi:hypothetical protein